MLETISSTTTENTNSNNNIETKFATIHDQLDTAKKYMHYHKVRAQRFQKQLNKLQVELENETALMKLESTGSHNYGTGDVMVNMILGNINSLKNLHESAREAAAKYRKQISILNKSLRDLYFEKQNKQRNIQIQEVDDTNVVLLLNKKGVFNLLKTLVDFTHIAEKSPETLLRLTIKRK